MTKGIRASPCHRRYLRETLSVIPVLTQWKPICFRWAYLFSSGNGKIPPAALCGDGMEGITENCWIKGDEVCINNEKTSRKEDRPCSSKSGLAPGQKEGCVSSWTLLPGLEFTVTPAALLGSSLQLVPHRSGYMSAQALKEHMHTQRHVHTLTCSAGWNTSSFSTPGKVTHPCQHQPSWLEKRTVNQPTVLWNKPLHLKYLIFFKIIQPTQSWVSMLKTMLNSLYIIQLPVWVTKLPQVGIFVLSRHTAVLRYCMSAPKQQPIKWVKKPSHGLECSS